MTSIESPRAVDPLPSSAPSALSATGILRDRADDVQTTPGLSSASSSAREVGIPAADDADDADDADNGSSSVSHEPAPIPERSSDAPSGSPSMTAPATALATSIGHGDEAIGNWGRAPFRPNDLGYENGSNGAHR